MWRSWKINTRLKTMKLVERRKDEGEEQPVQEGSNAKFKWFSALIIMCGSISGPGFSGSSDIATLDMLQPMSGKPLLLALQSIYKTEKKTFIFISFASTCICSLNNACRHLFTRAESICQSLILLGYPAKKLSLVSNVMIETFQLLQTELKKYIQEITLCDFYIIYWYEGFSKLKFFMWDI